MMNTHAYWLGYNLRYGETRPSFNFTSDNDQGLKFEANPSNDVTLMFIGPQYSFGLQLSSEKEDDGEYLESSYSDFLITFFTQSYMAELYYSDFNDFYIQNDREEIITNQSQDLLNGSRIGVQTTFYLDGSKFFSIHGEYILAPETGVGSFYKFRFEHFELDSTNGFIPAKYQNDFKKIATVDSFQRDLIDLEVGTSAVYAWDKFFVNGYIMLGPIIESQLYQGDTKESEVLVTPAAEALIGAAYYNSGMQVGLRAKYFHHESQINGIKFSDIRQTAYLYFTYLF